MVEYRPKHLVYQGPEHLDHSCADGCTPQGCVAGCCLFEPFHKRHCIAHPVRQFDEARHQAYVVRGLRRHLAEPFPS
jgi:hypothetical protein